MYLQSVVMHPPEEKEASCENPIKLQTMGSHLQHLEKPELSSGMHSEKGTLIRHFQIQYNTFLTYMSGKGHFFPKNVCAIF